MTLLTNNEDNFQEELKYVKDSDGIAISERQFHHVEKLVSNSEVKSILIFPLSGKPEETISQLKDLTILIR